MSKVIYTDLPALAETFADHVGAAIFDGLNVRVTLLVTRNALTPGVANPDAIVVPAARLVLTKDAAEGLHQRLGEFLKSLDSSRQTKQ